MAKFLLMFRNDPAQSTRFGQMSPEEMQKDMQKWMAWIGDLTRKGAMQGGEPLEKTGKTLKGRKKELHDGPFAEVKDVVNGYLLISAESIDHAVELSRGCPIFELDGSCEVRPVANLNMQ